MPDHIIHKQKVTLRVTSQEDGFAMQNRISRLLKDDMPSVIESVLNEISPNGKILRIDKLEIDLGTISRMNLEKEFTEKLIGQLTKALSSLPVDERIKEAKELRKEESLLDSLIYFLRHGYLPWYSPVKDFNSWESELMNSFTEKEWRKLITLFKRELQNEDYPVPRLARQFSWPFLQIFLGHIYEKHSIDRISLLDDLWIVWDMYSNENSDILYEKDTRFRQDLLNSALTANDEHKFIYGFLKRILAKLQLTGITKNSVSEKLVKKILFPGDKIKTRKVNDALQELIRLADEVETLIIEEEKSVESKEEKKPIPQKKAHDDDELFARNCGIILLYPFIQMYFSELDLLEEDQFRDESARERAVLLLHYLATGETTIAEIHLVMSKFLCAMDFDQPAQGEIVLTEKEQEESDTLLKSLLGHWPALGNTSIEGLRQTFLQREGKLIRTDTGWKLWVEQKAVDILLNRLPWGISTIRLPWMVNVLNVEWI